MKTVKKLTVAALVIGMSLTANQVMAGNGHGGSFQHNGTALNTAATDICNSDIATIAGVVTEAGLYGQGMQIDTGSEVVTVYGVGPLRYWTSVDVDRPAVGDEVSVEAALTVFSDGTEKSIAISITIGDETIDLRDDDCLPMWRGGNRVSLLDGQSAVVARNGRGGGNGPGDGTGNGGNGPGDGSGNGPGTGDCVNG
jgi:hypothetical protein